jgi:alanyl aminopeptidase
MSPRRPTLLATLLAALVVCVLAACGSSAKTGPDPAAAQPAAPATDPAPTAAAVDPPQPTLRLPRNFLPTGYRARLAIDPASDVFAGSIEIAGDIKERSKAFWLHGRKLKISAAKITRGERTVRVDVVPAGDDLLSFRPAEPLDPGPITVAVEYTGSFDIVEGMGAYKRLFDDVPYIETQFESIHARRVFPCFDEPENKVPWQLTLDVPTSQVAVANTMQTSETAVDAQTKRVAFAPTRPLPTYLIAFGVGPFEFVDAGKTRGGVPIRIIALKGRSHEAKWSAETAARIVGLLEDYFGIPYPYDKLDHISRPSLQGGAMENAGLITYGKRLILRDPAQITHEEKLRWVSVAAHELAHQWFGDLVTMAWWDDLWLNEGFATWLASKIVVQFDPALRGELLDTNQRETALNADRVVNARRIRQPITNPGDIFQAFDGITYQKGASILAMFVRAYLNKHRDGNATSADFLAAISEAAGRDVAPAFSSFLDQAGAPVVRAELRCDAGQPPALLLSQHRYVLPGSPPPPEGTPWRMPVCVAYDRAGARGETCTELTSTRSELALDTKTCPAWVFANAGARGYYRTSQPESAIVALRDRGWKLLTPTERMVAFSDVSAFAATGELDVAVQMSFVPKLLAERHRVAVTAAANAANQARRVVATDKLPRLDAWIRATFGPAARALGWQARPRDDIDAERSRAELVSLVAWSGDPALRAGAVALARNWKTLGGADRGLILSVAADADAAIFERLLAAAPVETNPDLRADLLRAISVVSDEARLRLALALTFDKRLDAREARGLLLAGRTPQQARVVEAYFRERIQDILARFPDNGGGGAAGLANAFLRSCDATKRDDAAAFVKQHFSKFTGSPRIIARGLEGFDQCVAARNLLGPKLEAWLAKATR